MSGDDLFSMADERSGREYAPLAVRMRPESLDDVYGQDELIGPGSFLRMMIERDTIPSFYSMARPVSARRPWPMSSLRKRTAAL